MWRINTKTPNTELQILSLKVFQLNVGINHSLLPLRIQTPIEIARPTLIIHTVGEQVISEDNSSELTYIRGGNK